jgi:hypothetical protein
MAITLADVTESATPAELIVVDGPVTHAGRTLAVAQTGGVLVLVRERVRSKVGPDGKRAKEHGEERDYVRTARIVDIAAAIAGGLLA